ncbi:hypothetical protein ACFQ4L_08580 [Lapidilactobacillus mulanensis]|uniref:PX domain-containing protein n=1 Tax=Lapidilactobacillus mulanensis TaxID=2485999 RepID=A0ABW4DRK3_9LACO|nr:hypothetical protein [Lapidilactobacillus mulanensis]
MIVDIWVRGEFNQSLRHFEGTAAHRERILSLHYQDFHSLNAILKKEYQLSPPNFVLPVSCPVFEIDASYLPSLLNDLKADFSDVEQPLRGLRGFILKHRSKLTSRLLSWHMSVWP